MQRKVSTLPTRIYTYGACKPRLQEDLDLLDQQFKKANEYYNKRIEVERWRRDQILMVQKARADLGHLILGVESSALALEAARDAQPKDKERVKALAVELRAKRAELKAAKVLLKTDPQLIAEYERVSTEANEKAKVARGESGLYWGTYELIDKAMEAVMRAPTPPRFRPYDRTGRIGVRLTGGGLPVPTAYSDEDTRLRIIPPPEGTYQLPRHRRRIASRTRVRIRVGTDDSRQPIWMEFPVILHRPLPSDGIIKGAWILRRKIGYHFKYQLQVVVEAPSFARSTTAVGKGVATVEFPGKDGIAAIMRSISWSVGQLAGTKEDVEYIQTPENVFSRLEKCDSLRSIRDRNFNAAVEKLVQNANTDHVPQWILDEMKRVGTWRSCNRLRGVIERWALGGVIPDPSLLQEMLAWAKQERHLLAWESHQRERAIGHRREMYRLAAQRLCKQYACLVLERVDLRATERGLLTAEQRKANITASGEFRSILREVAGKFGCKVEDVEKPPDEMANT